VIVRRIHDEQEFREETVLRVGHKETINENNVQQQIEDALRKLLKHQESEGNRRK
jgi:hypothetical protein